MSQETTNVFLADDHTMVREGLAALVDQEKDLRVVGQCGDGLKVMERLLQLKPDVAVLDIGMPGLNGLDICREVHRKLPAAGVLILTMHDEEQFVAEALENGATGYLLKESAPGKLPQAIRSVAGRDVYLGPGVPRDALSLVGRKQQDKYQQLTSRERQVLQLICEGMTNRQVAQQLNLAIKTIDTHRTRLMAKLDIHNQTELVKFALRRGIISLD
jgi:DNA-binding NarL/FixJ family response regulator